MKHIKNLLTGITPVLLLSGANAAAQELKPNILVVLCDDLGYADVGFNGSHDIITPNLDELANSGAVFSSAYVTHPFSGPSRASLMTGRYPHFIGTPYNLHDSGVRTDDGVPTSETYISEVLQDAGYYTSVIGKWHLGYAPKYHPNNRGFNEFYGFLGGGHEYLPEKFSREYKRQKEAGQYPIREYIKPLLHNNTEVEETEYVTDALSRESIRIIKETAQRDESFFIYLAYNAPHTPLQAKAEDMEMFEHITDRDRKIYAAMVYAVDRGVGKIVETLKETGQYENTMIVFLSDNGGSLDHGACNQPLKGTKGDTWEGGYRVPMFIHYPSKIKSGIVFNEPVSSLDLYPTLANIAGATIPGHKILDGLDIMPALTNGSKELQERTIYALRYREGYCDVGARKGDWKITRMGNEPWLLFNVTNDLGEKRNMGYRYPERLEEMVNDMKSWTEDHVNPLWVYSKKDAELWENGVLPGYDDTFEVDKLVLSGSKYNPQNIKNGVLKHYDNE